jgi:DNA polymerase-4
LPVYLVPGIERDDLLRLREFNLTHAFQVAVLSLEQLEIPFAARARLLYEAVRGIDPSPVLPVGQKPPQVIADHEFGTDTNDAHALQSVLYRLVEQVGVRLRKRRRTARRIAIVLDYSDGMRRTRQVTARPATANDLILFELARRALQLAWKRRVRIRHLRLICDRLIFPPAQLELFAADQKADQKRSGLISAIDTVRQRFGHESIRFGRTLAA